MTIEARLAELGIELPVPAAPVAAYVPVVVSGMLALMQEFFEQRLPTGARRTNSPALTRLFPTSIARTHGSDMRLTTTEADRSHPVGPGPGDPRDAAAPKMVALRALLTELLASGRPTLAVCLGHQLLAGLLGLPLHRRDAPYQGLPRDVPVFGTTRRVGFYASFTALADADRVAGPYGPVEVSRDPADGAVHALRGAGFAGVQFHPESVLSQDGTRVLADLLGHLLDRPALSAHGAADRG